MSEKEALFFIVFIWVIGIGIVLLSMCVHVDNDGRTRENLIKLGVAYYDSSNGNFTIKDLSK